MATNLNTILSWFKTGLKPTQAQFWASWQSFWHKDEQIPQSNISDLTSTLNAKAEKSQLEGHTTDVSSHKTLFDQKEDKSQKGKVNGYAPLDEFSKLASLYLDMVDDLVTGGKNPLTADQGVVLQTQIEFIKSILASDNTTLDTVQELVDAVEKAQSSIETFLVNDLTTGGVSKALTAEMGKLLQSTKVDKTAGKSLIADTEISRLATLKNTELINDFTTGGTTKALTAEMGKSLQSAKVDKTAGKSLIADAEISRLATVTNSVIASDPETQISATVVEDNKVISRLKLFNWWTWAKNQAWTFRNKITLAVGTTTTPPLIIPNGILTTTPQNGAIERDSYGVLWETRNGIRKRITPTITISPMLLCINMYSNGLTKPWDLELTHDTTTYYTILAAGAQDSIKAFCGLDFNNRPHSSPVQKESEYYYLFNIDPEIKLGFLIKSDGITSIVDLDKFLGETTNSNPFLDNSYKHYKNSIKIFWSNGANTIQLYLTKESSREYMSLYPDTLDDLNLIAYTTNALIKTVPSQNLALSYTYYSQERFQDNFVIS